MRGVARILGERRLDTGENHECSLWGRGGFCVISWRAIREIDKQMVVLLFLIVVIATVMARRNPFFLTLYNFEVMAQGFLFEALMALGMTLVIVSGGIHLSVVVCFPCGHSAWLCLPAMALNHFLAMPVVIAASAVVGLINNEMRRNSNIPP